MKGMRSKAFMVFFMTLLVLVFSGAVGCTKKEVPEEEPQPLVPVPPSTFPTPPELPPSPPSPTTLPQTMPATLPSVATIPESAPLSGWATPNAASGIAPMTLPTSGMPMGINIPPTTMPSTPAPETRPVQFLRSETRPGTW